MRLIFIVIIYFFLFSTSCFAKETEWKGRRIDDYRAFLLNDGWKPFTDSGKEKGYDFDPEAESLSRLGFIEVRYCTLIGIVRCVFVYKKKEKCIRVETRGEHSQEDNIFPIVTGLLAINCSKEVSADTDQDFPIAPYD
jgi:hypothetical protein